MSSDFHALYSVLAADKAKAIFLSERGHTRIDINAIDVTNHPITTEIGYRR